MAPSHIRVCGRCNTIRYAECSVACRIPPATKHNWTPWNTDTFRDMDVAEDHDQVAQTCADCGLPLLTLGDRMAINYPGPDAVFLCPQHYAARTAI